MALKDNYFTISEAAKELRVTRQTISRWIAEGKLPSEKVGRETIIEKKEISQYKRDRQITEEGEHFVGYIIAYIQKTYGYSEGNKIDILRFEKKKVTFWFYNKKQDGTCEIIKVTLGTPEEIAQNEGRPFIVVGIKFPIIKMDRRASTESELRSILNKEARRLKTI